MTEEEAVFREAIERNPHSAIAYYNLGLWLTQDPSRTSEAEAAYHKAIELAPDNARYIYRLGLLLHENLQRFEEAEVAYRHAIDLAPDDVFYYGGLISLLVLESRRSEALALSIKMRAMLNASRNWYGLATLDAILGNNEAAIRYLRQAAGEANFDPQWARKDADLASIRDDPRFDEIVGRMTQAVGRRISSEFVMLTLVEPSLTYKEPCLDAVREFHAAGEYSVDAEQLGAMFEELIARLAAAKDPANAPPGELPYEDFWLMEGEEWIGKLTLRTTINAKYLYAGGHIGYEIRPSKRRQGYGTALLRMGLEKARERGLQRVLLTCDETNLASRKVIENNGGQLENAVQVEGQTVLKMRYWINLDERTAS